MPDRLRVESQWHVRRRHRHGDGVRRRVADRSFTTLGKQFEAAHPGTTVKFNFGASSSLAENINQGAPADVFASASSKNMKQVVDAGGASDSKTFANNVMQIAVPPDNPANVSQVTDLANPEIKVALCQPEVPCGTVAQEVFKKADVTVKPVTQGADVKAVLTTVQLGEVDAGMVYKTDVQAAGTKVKGIEIPADQNASTSYPIAALSKAPNAAGAAAFVDYVLSPTVRRCSSRRASPLRDVRATRRQPVPDGGDCRRLAVPPPRPAAAGAGDRSRPGTPVRPGRWPCRP